MTTYNILFQLGFLVIALNWFLCINLAWKYNNKAFMYLAFMITVAYVIVGSAVIGLAQ